MWDHFGADQPTYDEIRLARTMHEAWVSFFKGGVPRAAGLPAWPAYSLRTRSSMVFDKVNRVENDPQSAERRAWDGLLTG